MNTHKLSLLVLTCITLPSWADDLPGIIDKDNPTRVARAVRRAQAAATVQPNQPQPQAQSQSAITLDTVVEFRALQFAGGTKYAKETLYQPFAGLIGKRVTLGALAQATQAITDMYHKDGYPLSFAYLPTNNFQQGVVTVALVEGYLSEVNIDSDNQPISERLQRLSKPLLADKPLTSRTFERYSLLMSRIPDTTVVASADLPNNTAGATPLRLKSTHPHNWNVGSTIDSRKGSHSAFINATFSGFTSFAEQFGIATLVPLDNKSRQTYLGLNYQQYLTDNGLQMQLKGSYYRQKPKKYDYLLSDPNNHVDLEAKKTQTQYNAGAQLSYPLLLTTKEQWQVTAGADYTNKSYDYQFRLRQNNIVSNIDIANADQKAKYSAAELGLSGIRIYDMAYWALRLNLRQGLGGSITNNQLDTDLSFTRWRLGGDVAYYFSPTWRISSAVDGFWSDNNLPEAERIGYGGLRYGRGYADGEISGDYGYGGQVELRYLHELTYRRFKTIQPYVVIDNGKTYFNDPIYKTRQIASYALGATVSDNKYYNISFEAARPIASLPSDSASRNVRFNLTFSYNFNAN